MHVGIDTVGLGGEGFEVHVAQGDRVRCGDRLLSFDLDLLARKAKSLITPVIVTNGERFTIVAPQMDREVRQGDVLFEIEPLAIAQTVAGNEAAAAEVVERIVVEHEHGIHARPAALIANFVRTLPFDVEVRAHGRTANARSAVALMSLGRAEEAYPYSQEALEMKRKLYGDVHPEVASALNNLAYVFEVADNIAVLYLGQMVAQVETKDATRDDVVGYITGTKTLGVEIVNTSNVRTEGGDE